MPARKPPSRRQGRGTNDVGLVTIQGAPDISPPDPPASWLAATKRDWVGFWSSSQAALVLPADVPALERLYGYRDELSRAQAGFRKQRFVDGSKGQPVLNPLAEHVARLERLIAPLEDRFGLSPLARLRLGVTFGQARTALEDVMSLDDDEHEQDPRLSVVDVGEAAP